MSARPCARIRATTASAAAKDRDAHSVVTDARSSHMGSVDDESVLAFSSDASHKLMAVIAAGGGGIPVVRIDGRLRGVEAVIDKDLATAMLALGLAAERMVLVTDVEGIYRDFDSANPRLLRSTTPEELDQLASEGQFPAGSMGPKAAAAAHFARRSGRPAIVCRPEDLAAAIDGRKGTMVSMEG